MNPIISARGLTKRYGRTVAVDHIDLNISPGRIVGLIGPNGAGKTTALKAILGLVTFDGELSVLGKNPARDRAVLMEDVCFIADVAVLPRWIRVWQLIDLTEQLHPKFSREKCLQYLADTKVTLDHKSNNSPRAWWPSYTWLWLWPSMSLCWCGRTDTRAGHHLPKTVLHQPAQRLFRRAAYHPDHNPPGRGNRTHPD